MYIHSPANAISSAAISRPPSEILWPEYKIGLTLTPLTRVAQVPARVSTKNFVGLTQVCRYGGNSGSRCESRYVEPTAV